ncbi:MAG: RNA methyltransferase [Phycisphaeraceae bacterium]|nr:RNA methyltransferase [Phycisphaeraceae bacterium]
MSDDPTSVLLEGRIAVEAALRGRFRDIDRLLLEKDDDDRRTRRLERDASGCGVPVRRAPRSEIDAMASGKTHGGVLAVAGPRRFQALDDLVPADRNAFIAMLDGIEDPYNLGYALRSLHAFGVDGVVVRVREWTSSAATVIRASAGASELLPMAQVDEPGDAVSHFRDRGIMVAATGRHDGAVSIFETDLSPAMFLIIGGERRGIQRSCANAIDLWLTIPYDRPFEPALATVSAAAVIGFEVMRQRTGGR